MSGTLLDLQQFHVEGQVRVRWYERRSPLLAVGQVRRYDEPPFAFHLHCRQSLIPARDDLACAENELERCPCVQRAAELRAILTQPAGVVYYQGLPRLGRLPRAR